jgi:dCTP deaminase
MILTGAAIAQGVDDGRITITPFDPCHIQANSYQVRLGASFLTYREHALDARVTPSTAAFTLPATGAVLEPGKLYLARTVETLGSPHLAMTLDAEPRISALGMWIQLSAPLAHVGAIIPWTLEIAVTQPLLVYPGMAVGRVAFWQPVGHLRGYHGRYAGSTDVVASRLLEE